VKLAVTHHTVTTNGDSWQLTAEKALVFILDAPKQPDTGKKTKKKSKRGSFNTKNFGSIMSVDKMKNAKRFITGWRCRHPWVSKPN